MKQEICNAANSQSLQLGGPLCSDAVERGRGRVQSGCSHPFSYMPGKALEKERTEGGDLKLIAEAEQMHVQAGITGTETCVGHVFIPVTHPPIWHELPVHTDVGSELEGYAELA